MITSSLVFRAIVRVSAFNSIRTFIDHLMQEISSRELSFIWKNCGVEFARKIINGDEEIFSSREFIFSLDERKPFGVEVNKLSRI